MWLYGGQKTALCCALLFFALLLWTVLSLNLGFFIQLGWHPYTPSSCLISHCIAVTDVNEAMVHMGAKPWYSLNHLPPISLQFLCWGRILQHCLGWPLTHSVAQVGFESVCFNCLSSCNCAWPHNPAAPLWKGPTHNSGLTWLSSQDSGLSFSLSSISL